MPLALCEYMPIALLWEFETTSDPFDVRKIPEGLFNCAFEPRIARVGLASPLNPDAKTKTACALSSATYMLPFASTAMPTG